MNQYLLDTNTVSHVIRGHSAVLAHVTQAPMSSLCISVITEAELLFGLAKRPEATRLRALVQEFLYRVNILQWDSNAAKRYAAVRSDPEAQGITLSPMDMLIAAHAMSQNLILVTGDQAFTRIKSLHTQDWSSN